MEVKNGNRKIIALTGAMGSGKSTVADLFRKQGAWIVNADTISRRLVAPSASGWCAIRAVFGDRFFNDDLTLDRTRLRTAIFSDEELRQKINAILHPLIRNDINGICRGKTGLKQGVQQNASDDLLAIVEVPLLFEVGWQDDFDIVIVVSADVETCLGRIMARDGVDRQSAVAAFATQMSLAEKIRLADYVIDNNGDLGDTTRQVAELYRHLLSSR